MDGDDERRGARRDGDAGGVDHVHRARRPLDVRAPQPVPRLVEDVRRHGQPPHGERRPPRRLGQAPVPGRHADELEPVPPAQPLAPSRPPRPPSRRGRGARAAPGCTRRASVALYPPPDEPRGYSPRSRHRHRRPGREPPGRAAARAGLRGLRRRPPRLDRLPEPRRDPRPAAADRRRPARPPLARGHAPRGAAARALQPRLGLVRAGLVGRAGADRRVRGRRRDDGPRGDPPRRPRDPLLPGVVERDLRRAAGGAADRADAAAAADALRRREGVRALHRRQLPPPLRPARLLRDPLQPRVAAAPARLPPAQGLARGRADRGGPAGRALGRRPRRAARLGLGRGLRPRDVADAPAGRGRRLRDRDGRDAFRRGARRVRVRPRRARPDGVRPRRRDPAAREGAAARPRRRSRRRRASSSAGSRRVDFEGLVALLVDADVERVRAEVRGSRDREALPPG